GAPHAHGRDVRAVPPPAGPRKRKDRSGAAPRHARRPGLGSDTRGAGVAAQPPSRPARETTATRRAGGIQHARDWFRFRMKSRAGRTTDRRRTVMDVFERALSGGVIVEPIGADAAAPRHEAVAPRARGAPDAERPASRRSIASSSEDTSPRRSR